MIENSSENIDILPTPEANAPGSAGVGIRQAVLAQSGWWKRISIVLLVAGIGWLAWFSFYLAGMRIYQVDECLNVFRAFRMATHQPVPGPDLFQIILTWVLPIGSRATNLFATARLVSWLIFWLNLILLAMATGERIFSRRWLIALAGAVTLAPLWDFGFEARHDNLLLTGILLMWGVVRFQPPKMGAFFFRRRMFCRIGIRFQQSGHVHVSHLAWNFRVSAARRTQGALEIVRRVVPRCGAGVCRDAARFQIGWA
jgi:hypothetical protein